MKDSHKKFVLIENKSQVEEYLKQRKKFKGFIPITVSFEAEELLYDNKIKFKQDDDYESGFLYKEVYSLALKETKEVCKTIKINYRGIDLFTLFYMNLFRFLGMSNRFLKLLKRIKDVKEIVIFDSNSDPTSEKEICSRIAQEVFRGKTKIIKYTLENKKNNFLIQIVGYFQNFLSNTILTLSTKKDNKIFFCEGKVKIIPVINELLKNKRNKMFRCHSDLKKSFVIGKKYIPFYQFSKEKSIYGKRLLEDIKKFKRDNKDFSFLDNIGIEKERLPSLKKWIDYYLKIKLLEMSEIINHIIRLIKKNKIDFILVYADTTPFEKTLVQVGRMFNIPSAVLQHGNPMGTEAGFYPLSANFLLAFGENHKQKFIRMGIPENRIIITGSPQFDKYTNEKIKITKDKKIVYIASSGDSTSHVPGIDMTKKEQKKDLREVINIMKKFPEYKLVVKGREGWDMNPLIGIIAKEEKFNNLEFVESATPLEFLPDAEIVIIEISTLAFDALLLDKPVISKRIKEYDKLFSSYKDSKTIKTVYTPKQLEKALKYCKKKRTEKSNLERKKYLEGELFKLDGQASKRVAKVINKLILERKLRIS